MTSSKSTQQRAEECVRIARQLKDMAMYDDVCHKLNPIMNEFIRDGTPVSGSFRVERCDRRLEYQLSNRADSFAVLRR